MKKLNVSNWLNTPARLFFGGGGGEWERICMSSENSLAGRELKVQLKDRWMLSTEQGALLRDAITRRYEVKMCQNRPDVTTESVLCILSFRVFGS